MSLVSALPRFVSLTLIPFGSNNVDEYGDPRFAYGRYVAEEGNLHGHIRCSLDDRDEHDNILSPYAKYEVVRTTTEVNILGEGEDVMHLRNCFSGKFLRRVSQTNWRMVAAADAPEEDSSKWSSTLITLRSPLNIAGPQSEDDVYILFSQADGSSRRMGTSNDSDRVLACAGGVISTVETSFSLHSLEKLIRLPRYISFIADNGMYAARDGTDSHLRIRFDPSREIEDPIDHPDTHFEVLQLRNGAIRIRSLVRNLFLIIDSNWGSIHASGQDLLLNNQNSRRYMTFYPLRLEEAGKAFMALQNIFLKTYAIRTTITTNQVTTENVLGGMSPEITRAALFKVQELVRTREIYNVYFRAAESRIHEPSPMSIVTKDVANYSPVSTQTAELSFTYTEYESHTYSGSHSWGVSLNYTATVSARLPILKFISAEATVTLDASYEGSYEWGSAEEETKQLETKFVVSVPPATRSKVGMVVSRAAIDLPFSYTQRDTLFDWSYRITQMHDGLFHGENTYVNYDVVDEPLEGPPKSGKIATLEN